MGSGSGVAAIAAKQAGAAKVWVWACDNDKQALLATKTNAELNQVDIELCANINDLPQDLVLLLIMADVYTTAVTSHS